MRNYISSVMIFIVTFLLLLSPDILKAQENPQEMNNTGKWFSSKEVAEGVYCIDDHGGDNMYLVLGKKKALLIDTGTGVSDLKKYVTSLSNLPLMILNTHGHPDHVGNNFQFDEVYVHPEDFEYVKQFSTEDFRKSMVDNAMRNFSDLQSEMITEVTKYKMPDLLPVKQGYIFDLGDRKLEVIWVPGHTMGSICLIDKEHKQLFSGDNNNTHVWLFLDGCPPVEKYLESLDHLMSYSENFDIIFPGHGDPLDKDYLSEIHTCVDNILKGNCESTAYKNQISDKAMQCTYKRALVAFDPDNLFYKKTE